MKRKVGRPSKLTPQVRDAFISAIRSGNYIEDAANFAGVGSSTVERWMQLGREGGRKEYQEFLGMVEKAQSEAIVRDLALIATAATTDAKHAEWILEHRHPRKFGARVAVEVSQELEAFFERLRKNLPPDTYELVVAAARSDT